MTKLCTIITIDQMVLCTLLIQTVAIDHVIAMVDNQSANSEAWELSTAGKTFGVHMALPNIDSQEFTFNNSFDIFKSSLISNLEKKIFVWNKTAMSHASFQHSYCNQKCIDGKAKGTHIIQAFCPDISCFPCDCIRPQCEIYHTCCPDISTPISSNTSTMVNRTTIDDSLQFPPPGISLNKNFEDSFETNSSQNLTVHDAFSKGTGVHIARKYKYVKLAASKLEPKIECDTSSFHKTFLYVRSCSPEAQVSDGVKSLCESDVVNDDVSVESVARVVDNRTGAVYYNKYCAICNGVKMWLAWSVTVDCRHFMRVYTATTPDQLLRQGMRNDSLCRIAQRPPRPDQELAECDAFMFGSALEEMDREILCQAMTKRDVIKIIDPEHRSRNLGTVINTNVTRAAAAPIDACNVTGLWPEYDLDVEEGCHSLTSHIYRVFDDAGNPPNTLYTNIFCAMCNTESYSKYGECGGPASDFLGFRCQPPFSILLGIHKPSPGQENYIDSNKCRQTEWLSPNGDCLPWRCSPGKILVNGTCQTGLKQITGLGYRLRLWFFRKRDNATATRYKINQPPAVVIIKSFYDKLHSKLSPLINRTTFSIAAVVNMSEMPDFYGRSTHPMDFLLTTSRTSGWESLDTSMAPHNSTNNMEEECLRQFEFQVPFGYWVAGFVVAANKKSRDEFEEALKREVLQEVMEVEFGFGVNGSFQPVVMWADHRPEVYCAHVREVHPEVECYHDQDKTSKDENNSQFKNTHQDINGSITQDFDYFLNFSEILTCSYLTLHSSMFFVESNTNDVLPRVIMKVNFGGVNVTFSNESDLNKMFLGSNGTLNVCRELLENHFFTRRFVSDWNNEMLLIQHIMTVVCLSISMACLLLALTTYAMFPTLRSLAGRNNVCLCMSLMLAQASILTTAFLSPEDGAVCVVIAVVTHFLWLCALCWSFLCCFHMFRVFTANTRSSYTTANTRSSYTTANTRSSYTTANTRSSYTTANTRSSYTTANTRSSYTTANTRSSYTTARSRDIFLAKNLACSLSLPALVVVSVVVTMYAMSGGHSIGYGGSICYLNSNILVGTVTVLPMLSVSLINIGFFLITVTHIHRVRKLQKHESFQRTDLHHLYVYVKLSTMTGATWLLSVAGEAFDLDAARIAGILLNGLQGLFIFISYICNKRVLSLYLRRLGFERSSSTSVTVSSMYGNSSTRLTTGTNQEAHNTGPSSEMATVCTDGPKDEGTN